MRRVEDFNPHSPCGERLFCTCPKIAGSNFNPHSPCGERLSNQQTMQLADIFQSTLPLRGATWACRSSIRRPSYFNPHSPCGERLAATNTTSTTINFNPHSPCGERRIVERLRCTDHEFQSTLPLRGATSPRLQYAKAFAISIHTPLAGSDSIRQTMRPFD